MTTDRLVINKVTEKDKEDYFINISHDKKVLETFVCTYCENLDEFDFARYLDMNNLFAIRLKDTGRLIGIILWFGEEDKTCEIGYGIGSGYWNKGYATEAVGRFIKYCFEELGYKKIYASYFTGNDASRNVMEKMRNEVRPFFRERN